MAGVRKEAQRVSAKGSARGTSPIWLTPAETGAMTGFSVKTIYRAMKAGELVASRVRSRYLIDPRDVARWVESCRVNAVQERSSTSLSFRPGNPESGSLAELRAIEREAA